MRAHKHILGTIDYDAAIVLISNNVRLALMRIEGKTGINALTLVDAPKFRRPNAFSSPTS